MPRSFRQNYIDKVEELAQKMRTEAMPEPTEELFALFEQTGNRLQYEAVYFKRRKFLAVFGMAALIFKRAEDVKKLEKVLYSVCEEECWALPAHVNRREDAQWRHSVDLFASETAQTLAEIISLVGEEGGLSHELCERVCKEIEERVFTPFFSSKPNYGCWECCDHNWNAVCAGGIGSACIYLMQGKEEERLAKCLERLCNSLTHYLDGFREDGTCMEGIGYFTYGMTYFVGFAEQLYRYTNGKTDLFQNEKLRKIAEFQQKMYFAGGCTVSFSDGEERAKYRMGLTSFLAEKYDTVLVPAEHLAAGFEEDTCYRFMGLCRDYLWTRDEEREETVQEAKSRHDTLESAQWSICESENGTALAIKGGHNGEPHNHNDIGSFLYLIGEEQLLVDLGAGEYTKEYFGGGRYEILCNSSLGHSVPIIGERLQKDGAWHKADHFWTDGNGITKVSYASAYPLGTVKELERETEFDMQTGKLTVTDRFTFEKYSRFTEQLVTRGKVDIFFHEDASVVRITGDTAACEIHFSAEIHHLHCMEKEHSNHQGETEIVRLIRWDVPVKLNETVATWFTVEPVEKK